MGRKLVFHPLAGSNRTAFVNAWHLSAMKVLAEVDREIQARPEAGREISKKGRFIQKIFVTVSPKTFLCEVVYSFTDEEIVWIKFAWKVVSDS
jgi:hypothetical protein